MVSKMPLEMAEFRYENCCGRETRWGFVDSEVGGLIYAIRLTLTRSGLEAHRVL